MGHGRVAAKCLIQSYPIPSTSSSRACTNGQTAWPDNSPFGWGSHRAPGPPRGEDLLRALDRRDYSLLLPIRGSCFALPRSPMDRGHEVHHTHQQRYEVDGRKGGHGGHAMPWDVVLPGHPSHSRYQLGWGPCLQRFSDVCRNEGQLGQKEITTSLAVHQHDQGARRRGQ